MNEKAQELIINIGERIFRASGYVALMQTIGGAGLPGSAQEEFDNLGEAMNALIELKKELGLTSNLVRVEEQEG